MGSEASANRLIETLPKWIGKELRLQVNLRKSRVGRPWERKFLGFRITREGETEVSPESINRFKVRVRELWDAQRNGTSKELIVRWQRFIRGWWNYCGLAEWRRPIFDLEGWIRRHIRKCFWLRWHCWKARYKRLLRLGVSPIVARTANSSCGAWRKARHVALHTALSNKTLRQYVLWMPSDLANQRK